MREVETIGDILSYVLGEDWDSDSEVLAWPPNVFAGMAFILKKSGDYIHVLSNWPPNGWTTNEWSKHIRVVAFRWRVACEKFWSGKNSSYARKSKFALPLELRRRISELRKHSGFPISSISNNRAVAVAVIHLLVIADEASAGFGQAVLTLQHPELSFRAQDSIITESTLTPDIAKTIATILPKQHTPSGGLSLRSLSHHLAFHAGADATAIWRVDFSRSVQQQNILIAPWPIAVMPKQFFEVAHCSIKMDGKFGAFGYSVEDEADVQPWLISLVQNAKKTIGRIDGIVFPECSLTPETFESAWTVAKSQGAYLIGGVLTPGSPPTNEVWVRLGSPEHYVQGKHHRWRIDRNQIEMYGIGAYLDPAKEWWEHIKIPRREVNFIEMGPELTMCCLICEDLARQEPVAELVRSVGPHLVVALLADGPQLSRRWPGRYATVLADDPGCSVLTVTSLGMTQLARHPEGRQQDRCVALWKDASGRTQEIVLPVNSHGAVLSLRSRLRQEWSADGRADEDITTYPELVGLHFLPAPRLVWREDG